MNINTHKKYILTILLLFYLSFCTSVILSHGGRTDSSGGHRDNKNSSGLGSYHYHHGYSAHLHKNGICPFTSKDNSNYSKPNNTNYAEKNAAINKGATNGYNAGYSKSSKYYEDYTGIYKNDYIDSYNKAYADGLSKINLELQTALSKGIEDGKNNIENSKNYSNKLIKDEYLKGVQQGNKEYIESNKELYIKLGKDDASSFKEIRSFDDNTVLELKNIYLTSYNNEMKKQIDKYIKIGYDSAINKKEYLGDNPKMNMYIAKGFEDGENQILRLENTYYNKGKLGQSFTVDEEFISLESELKSSYENGRKEKRRMSLIIGLISIPIILILIYIFFKKSKNNT